MGRKGDSSDYLTSHFFWTFPLAPNLFIRVHVYEDSGKWDRSMLLTVLQEGRENMRQIRCKVSELQRDGKACLGKVRIVIFF